MPRGVQRIVSLSPSNTEIAAALGLGRRLVGVDQWSDYPPAVKRLPKVGDVEADVERIVALAPDLVLACTSVPGMERNLQRLAAAGLPTLVLEPVGLETIFDSIRKIGEATGRERRAKALVESLADRREAVAERCRNVAERPRVYWEWWPKPLSAAAGASWMTHLIELAGGTNVFADVDKPSVMVDQSEILARAPEVIVACWVSARTLPRPERIAHRPGWEHVPAVQRGRVYVVPEGPFSRPGPRLFDGLERLAGLLHPESGVRIG